jgi:hypothetical protein
MGITPTAKGSLEVLVANGERLRSGGLCCGVSFKIGGFSFTVDFYILEIEGYEGVLGAAWLKTLGPILWDFSSLWMSFVWQGDRVVLQGISRPQDKIVDESAICKMLRGCQRGAILQIRAVCLGEKGEQTEALEDDLQNLLDQYSVSRTKGPSANPGP